MIECKDGTPVGDLCFKGLDARGVPEIGYGIAEQYLDMLPSAVCALVMGGAVWEMQKLEAGGFGPAMILLLQIAAGILLYTGFSFLLNRRTMLELLEVFRRRKTGETQADK